MVTHRWWGIKFCKGTCKDAYLRELALGRDKIRRGRRRWFSSPLGNCPDAAETTLKGGSEINHHDLITRIQQIGISSSEGKAKRRSPS